MGLLDIIIVGSVFVSVILGLSALLQRIENADRRADTHERQIDELDRRLNDHTRKRKRLNTDLSKDIAAITSRLDREDDYRREQREIEDANQ